MEVTYLLRSQVASSSRSQGRTSAEVAGRQVAKSHPLGKARRRDPATRWLGRRSQPFLQVASRRMDWVTRQLNSRKDEKSGSPKGRLCSINTPSRTCNRGLFFSGNSGAIGIVLKDLTLEHMNIESCLNTLWLWCVLLCKHFVYSFEQFQNILWLMKLYYSCHRLCVMAIRAVSMMFTLSSVLLMNVNELFC